MSSAIKGKQITWGVSATGVLIANKAVTAGIVESISVDRGGETAKITDEDGDIVTRIDHGAVNKIDLEVKALATSTVPAKGTELSGLTGTFGGVDLAVGRIFVESAKATEGGTEAKKISISAEHYPTMTADA